MKTIYVVSFLMFLIVPALSTRAQTSGGETDPSDQAIIKKFDRPQQFGEIQLTAIRHDVVNNQSCVIYETEVPHDGEYVLQCFGNFSQSNTVFVTSAAHGTLPTDLDPGKAAYTLKTSEDGWQAARATNRNGEERMRLRGGRVDFYFFAKEPDFPLADRISVTKDGVDGEFEENVAQVREHIREQIERGASGAPKEAEPRYDGRVAHSVPVATDQVIPNPQGNYSHQVNEWYNYSTFNYIYLTAGSVVTLETSGTAGGTSDPVLHLFDPNNPDIRSWTDDDSGPGLESSLTVVIPATASYVILVRPYSDNVTAVTNIKKNGSMYLPNTPIGGRRFTHTAYTGLRNFFTSYMIGDTRLFTLNGVASNVRGYNDDYWGPGTFAWGLQSRITKNFTSAINTSYVCAYSTSTYSSGICDTYMGNPNGAAYSWFPNYNVNDCIQSAPSSGVYNCISWSGGITTSWKWPPGDPMYAAATELGTFDKFYSNTPIRYTGAWNYSRAGANVNNAVIDLWKIGSGPTGYTHASVKKPGNNNPHGYDWESKPGSLDRSFHPRNALVGASYGSVTDYYVFTGTFARNAEGKPANKETITCDADAVRMGFDVYDNPVLSKNAQQKLTTLLSQTNAVLANDFAKLYDAWKNTWGDFENASNPLAYTKNSEYDALLGFSKTAGENVLPLLFNRYIQGDFLSTPLLWTLTKPTYGALIEEVQKDLLDNPNDEQGRHIIRSTFGNNVLYIEKILGALQPAKPTVNFTVNISPNPVQDQLNVDVTLTETAKVSINATAAKTGKKVAMVTEAGLPAGTHRFNTSVRQLAGNTGDIVLVQVQVNGIVQTVKVLVGQ
jgi:hypothetical protein